MSVLKQDTSDGYCRDLQATQYFFFCRTQMSQFQRSSQQRGQEET